MKLGLNSRQNPRFVSLPQRLDLRCGIPELHSSGYCGLIARSKEARAWGWSLSSTQWRPPPTTLPHLFIAWWLLNSGPAQFRLYFSRHAVSIVIGLLLVIERNRDSIPIEQDIILFCTAFTLFLTPPSFLFDGFLRIKSARSLTSRMKGHKPSLPDTNQTKKTRWPESEANYTDRATAACRRS
jgi:hypothetical protein